MAETVRKTPSRRALAVDILRRAARLPGLIVGGGLVGVIKAYQRLISPWIGPHCRFYPSCSEYFIQAVGKYGVLLGTWKGIGRILRCHPWHSGGYDPP
ncbi:MAG: membrane protein insertion efficiency factor YidD [Thermoguttaceae bacterium]